MFIDAFSSLPADLVFTLTQYKYWVLLPVLILEGPIATIVAAALAVPPNAVFHVVSLYFFVLFADVLADALYYMIGRYASAPIIAKIKTWKGYKEDVGIKARDYFKKYGLATLALAKISHGLGWPAMMVAGSVKIPFGKFITYCFLISIVKSAALVAIGYYFGEAYSRVSGYLSTVGILSTIVLIILVIVAFKILRKN